MNGHLGYSETEVARRVKTLYRAEDVARADVEQEYFGKLITELANARQVA
jgi:hypothetical protein